MEMIQGMLCEGRRRNKCLQEIDYAVQAHTLYTDLDPYLSPIRRTLSSSISASSGRAIPLIRPYAARAAAFAQDSPAIVSAILLVTVLYVAVQVLNAFRRMVVWWTKVIMKLLFWGAVGLVGSLIYQRGLEQCVQDAMHWGAELSEVWWREYRKWEGYSKQNQGMGGGYGGGSGKQWR